MQRKISLKEWLAEGERLFGPDAKNWKFKCPNCGHVQSINDFLELKNENIIKPDTDVGVLVYYSCIGRFDTRIPKDEVGTICDDKSPCDYTLGGLFCFASLIVIGEDGVEHPVFEFACQEKSEKIEEISKQMVKEGDHYVWKRPSPKKKVFGREW